jgi:YjbR
MNDSELPDALIGKLRKICARLPEVIEEDAWTGRRWKVRTKTFAHLVLIENGWPPVYARAVGDDGPVVVLTYRTPDPDLYRLGHAGPEFFWPGWFSNLAGIRINQQTDWARIDELLRDSYRCVAPRKLAAQVD